MEVTRAIVLTIARGASDCLFGCFNACRITDDCNNDDCGGSTSAPTSDPSTLVKRRAGHLKYSDRAKDSPKLKQRIILCCAWNGGLFLFSIVLFDHMLLPILRLIFSSMFDKNEYTAWSIVLPLLSWTFSALWVFPLFLLSKLTNSLWFNDIANAAYRRNTSKTSSSGGLPSIGKLVSDQLFSLLLQALFLVQASFFSFVIPIASVADFVYLFHMSIIYSLYAFEYRWYNMGWEVDRRLRYVQRNWPYFLGFGLPLAVLTTYLPVSSERYNAVSGCLFAVGFPLLIVSGHEAEVKEVNASVNYTINIFKPVTLISDTIFCKSVKLSHRWKTALH